MYQCSSFFVIFLFFSLIGCSSQYGNIESSILSKSTNKNDKSPNSQYAFVTSYTGESDDKYSFLQCIITLGGMLETVSPGYDRVLLIPSEIEISSSVSTILSKVWTHILKRNFLNCTSDSSDADEDYLFKLQAWTLTQYSKVLYIAADVLPLDDLSPLFSQNSPAAALDSIKYSMNQYNSFFNTDFMLFKPNKLDFSSLVRQVLINHSSDKQTTPDAFVINTVMQERISLFPLNTIIECGSKVKTILNEYPLNGTLHAKAIHYGHESKPWLTNTPLGNLWKLFASNINERISVPSTYMTLFNIQEDSESVDNFFETFKEKHSHKLQNVEMHNHYEQIPRKQQRAPIKIKNILAAMFLALFCLLLSIGILENVYNIPIRQILKSTNFNVM